MTTLRYIFSILCVFLVSTANAQFGPISVAPDTAKSEKDKVIVKQKITRDFKPSAIKVGMDVFGLGRTAFTSNFSHYEAQVDVDFYRYFLVLDLGRESNFISETGYKYNNEGSYFRFGLQANMTQFNKNGNVIFFGFRYARSRFDDEMSFSETTDKWGTEEITIANKNVSSRWFEINTGMKVQIVNNLFLGYTIRFKMAKKTSATEDLSPYIIPGFGLDQKGGNIGFNYYILYRLPFRNKKIPEKIIRARPRTTKP